MDTGRAVGSPYILDMTGLFLWDMMMGTLEFWDIYAAILEFLTWQHKS